MAELGLLLSQEGRQDAGLDQQVDALISSPAWLKINGLKKSRLTLFQVLAQIGFKHCEDYVHSLRKSVSSQYAGDLFSQFVRNGAVYNLTASPDQLEMLSERLDRKARLYQRRLEWLTTGSRQLFGVIQESTAVLVLDFGRAAGPQFCLSQDSVCRLIKEQVSRIARFNLLRSASVTEAWREKTVNTSAANIEAAMEWVRGLKHQQSSPISTAEALLKAMGDSAVEAIYLFAVGDFKGNMTNLLRNKLMKNVHPIHTISFNAWKEETIQALKALSHFTGGRFHAFAEMYTFEDMSLTSGEVSERKAGSPQRLLKPIGGVPPGAGVREDVFLVWREMQEARNTKAQIQALLLELPSPAPQQVPPGTALQEECLSSRAWLSRYGLKAQKLFLYDALADCAFRHADGVVDVKVKPEKEHLQMDAEPRNMLVNARYCDRFAHTRWKDGSVVHVYITAEKCKWYEERMEAALANLKRRLQWLQRGSRELFGAVLEAQVYILIDTSESMKDQLPLLKDNIFQLMQEQLCHKAKVNFVTFGSQVASWREKLVEVNERNLENAWNWVKGFKVGGSTNTLDALRLALADIDTQAVYLLTDGRPDQPSDAILAQVQLHPRVPVHTISFNCNDLEANRFLYELSQETGGRYHCYPCGTQEPGCPLPNESEDTHLLKKEIEQGKKFLETIQKLRADCVMLDWYHNGDHSITERSCTLAQSAPRPKSMNQWVEGCQRPHSAGSCPPVPSWQPATRVPSQHSRASRHAACTKASLLRFLSHGVSVADGDLSQDWMLPETLTLFQENADKRNQVFNSLELTGVDESQKKTRRRKPPQSLHMPTASWLRENSLIARKLTIIDALAPTAIIKKAKYVPILEKHIHSKVFDEVLNLAHLSSDARRLTLVNPLAVNLEDYKTRLLEALQAYQRRLDLIVWKALTPEEKEKFGSDKPVVFREHRNALIQALERLGWPVSRKDINLLEDQIRIGLSFLQQASDLQQAAREMASNHETRPSSWERSDLCPQARGAGDRNDCAQPKAKKKKPRRIRGSLMGQKVIARSEADGFYYPGTVRKCLNGKRVMIDFSRGDTEIIPMMFLITVGGAGPCPPLAVGDFVFVSSGKEGADDCFVPGVVIATPRRLEATDKLYTVLKYNNKKIHSMRSKIIKISQTRYKLTCCFIRERHELVDTVKQDDCHIQTKGLISMEVAKPVARASYGHGRTGSVAAKVAAPTRSERRSQGPIWTHSWSSLNQANSDSRRLGSDQDVSQPHADEELERLGGKLQRSSSSPLLTLLESPPESQAPTTPLVVQSVHGALRLHRGQAPPERNSPFLAPGNLEALAQELLDTLGQHRGQQEEIQKCVRALSEMRHTLLKPSVGSDRQEEPEQMTTQVILEELQKLILPVTMGASQSRDDSGGVPEFVNKARLLLPKVSPGQKVLARWSHDGWYHRSSVVHACGDQSFFVQSGVGQLERVWREDIITEGEDSNQEMKVEDPVIGANPLYPENYCPGAILNITVDLQMKVRYYDGTEALVSREDLYLISPQKFETDVAYILECEERWVGQPVIVRRDYTGTYHPAEVQQRVGNGRQYLIRWADGTTAVQDLEWIFGKWSPAHPLAAGDYVLALADMASHTFLPGVIYGFSGSFVYIQFINQESCHHSEIQHCFWLSEEQFNEASQLYNSQQRIELTEKEEEERLTEGTEGKLEETDSSVSSS